MKTFVLAVMIGCLAVSTYALSRSIGRDIEFPKNYDSAKAESIRKVVRDPRFHFVEGTVSYWPPDWATRLSFEGDVSSLNQFILELRHLPGIGFRLKIYRGRNDEARRDTSWQLDFSHARPDELTLYVNLNSNNLDFAKLDLPLWPAPER